MKIGICVGIDAEKMEYAKKIGYDFVEFNCGEIVRASEEQLEAAKKVGIPIHSANCFISHRVVGPERDDEQIKEYLATLFERASYLGMKVIVFGSSKARRKPDDMSLEECKAQTVDFIKRLVIPNCEKYGIRIAIEPLCKKECNWLNTVVNGAELADMVNSPYVQVLCDVKHMYEENEPFEDILKYADKLIHAHTSNPIGDLLHKRVYPKVGDKFRQDDFMLPSIEAGIETCSVEAMIIDFEKDVAEAYEALKKYRA